MPDKGSSSSKTQAESESQIGWRLAGTGFQVASEVAAGALLGWIYDWWRGSGHTGVIVGSIIGIIVGLWSLIRNALKLNRLLDQNQSQRNISNKVHKQQQSLTNVSDDEQDPWKDIDAADEWPDDRSDRR